MTHPRQVLSLCYRRFQFSREIGIAYLFMALRSVNTGIAPDVSLPWVQANLKQKTKWLGVFWHKAIGPFDITSFKHIKHFCLFWLGEKFQGAGFLWGLGYQYYLEKIGGCERLIRPQFHLK